MLNFNPYFRQQDAEGDPFISKTYASDIVNILYPEDILSSEIEKSSDVSRHTTDRLRLKFNY